MPYTNYANPLGADDELDLIDEPEDGALVGGIKSGFYGLGSSLKNTQAVAGRIAGADNYAAAREHEADARSLQAQEAGRMIPRLKDVSSLGGAYDWAAGMVGQNLPLFGAMAAANVLGGAAGAALMSRKAIAKSLGKAARKDALAAAAKQAFNKDIGERLAAAEEAQAIIGANNRSKLANVVREGIGSRTLGGKIGSYTGTVAPYLTTTVGDTYGSIRQDPEATGTPEERAIASLKSGAMQTSLGTLFEPMIGVVPKMMRGARTVEALAGHKAGSKAAMQAIRASLLGEGLTESGEQVIQQHTQNQFNPNLGYDGSQILEAGLGGALVGGVFSAPEALHIAMQKPQPRVNPVEQLGVINTELAGNTQLDAAQRTALLISKSDLLVNSSDILNPTDEALREAHEQITMHMEGLAKAIHEEPDLQTKLDILETAMPLVQAQGRLVESSPSLLEEARRAAQQEERGVATMEADLPGFDPNVADMELAIRRDKLADALAESQQVNGITGGAKFRAAIEEIDAGVQARKDAAAQALDPVKAQQIVQDATNKQAVAENVSPEAIVTNIARANTEADNPSVEAPLEQRAMPIRLPGVEVEPPPGKEGQRWTRMERPQKEGPPAVAEYRENVIRSGPSAGHYIVEEITTPGSKPQQTLIKLPLNFGALNGDESVITVNNTPVRGRHIEDLLLGADARGTPVRSEIFRAAQKDYREALLKFPKRVVSEQLHIDGLIQGEEDGTRYEHAIVPRKDNTYQAPTMVIRDTQTKRELKIPSTLDGLLDENVKYRGIRLLDDSAIKRMFIEAVNTGTPVPEKALFDAAQHAYEYRISGRARGTLHANTEDGRTTFQVEDDMAMDLRQNPLIAKYDLLPYKIKGNDFGAGFKKLVNLQHHEGRVLVANVDNQLFFGAKEARARLVKDMNVAKELTEDVNILARLGVLIKKESGDSRNVGVGHIVNRHGDQGNGIHTHDGVIGIVRGQQLNQGVAVRELHDATGNPYYEYDKGILRSPLQRLNSKGTVVAHEEESLNKTLQLTKNREELPDSSQDAFDFYNMYPVAKQQGGLNNYQQLAFGLEDPSRAYLADRINNIDKLSIESLLTGDQEARHANGVALPALIRQTQPLGLMDRTKADTARAYVMSSDELFNSKYNEGGDEAQRAEFAKRTGREYTAGNDDVLLLKGTYDDIKDAYKREHGHDLRPGDLLILHRDPALPDASSMSVYMYQGIAGLETAEGSHDKGVVVHTGSSGWRAAAGDFDGDSGVVIVPNDNMWPRLRRSQAVGDTNIDYVKKGAAKQKAVADILQEHLAKLVHMNPRVVDENVDLLDKEIEYTVGGKQLKRDMLSAVAAHDASGFSGMIGQIISPAQRLAEIGALDDHIEVDALDADGRPTGRKIKTTFGVLLSKIGQASISAKKKAVWAEQALAAFEQVQSEVEKRRPWMIEGGSGNISRYTLKSEQMLEKIARVDPRILSAVERRAVNNIFAGIRSHFSEKYANMSPRELASEMLANNTELATRDLKALNKIISYTGRRESYFSGDFAKVKRGLVDGSTAATMQKNLDRAHDAALTPKERENPFNIHTFAVDVQAPKGWRGIPRTKGEAWLTTRLHAHRVLATQQHLGRYMANSKLYVEMANRVMSLDRLYQELGVFNSRKFLEEYVNTAKEIAREEGTTREQEMALGEWKAQDADLARRISELDDISDKEELDALKAERAEMNANIRLAYTLGYVSGPQLVAFGPQGIAGREVRVSELEKIAKATKTRTSQKMQVMPADKDGKRIAAIEIPNGRYEWAQSGPNKGKFVLVKAYPTDNSTKQWAPGSVVLSHHIAPGGRNVTDELVSPIQNIRSQSEVDGRIIVALQVRSNTAREGSANVSFGTIAANETRIKDETRVPAINYKVGVGLAPYDQVRFPGIYDKLKTAAEDEVRAKISSEVGIEEAHAEELSEDYKIQIRDQIADALAAMEPVELTAKLAAGKRGKGKAPAAVTPVFITDFAVHARNEGSQYVAMLMPGAGHKQYFKLLTVGDLGPTGYPMTAYYLGEDSAVANKTARLLNVKVAAQAIQAAAPAPPVVDPAVPKPLPTARQLSGALAGMPKEAQLRFFSVRISKETDPVLQQLWTKVRAGLEKQGVDPMLSAPALRLLAEKDANNRYKARHPDATDAEIQAYTKARGVDDEYFKTWLTTLANDYGAPSTTGNTSEEGIANSISKAEEEKTAAPVVQALKLRSMKRDIEAAREALNMREFTWSPESDGTPQVTAPLRQIYKALDEFERLNSSEGPRTDMLEAAFEYLTTDPVRPEAEAYLHANAGLFENLGSMLAKNPSDVFSDALIGNAPYDLESIRSDLNEMFPQTTAYLHDMQAAAQAGQGDLFTSEDGVARSHTPDQTSLGDLVWQAKKTDPYYQHWNGLRFGSDVGVSEVTLDKAKAPLLQMEFMLLQKKNPGANPRTLQAEAEATIDKLPEIQAITTRIAKNNAEKQAALQHLRDRSVEMERALAEGKEIPVRGVDDHSGFDQEDIPFNIGETAEAAEEAQVIQELKLDHEFDEKDRAKKAAQAAMEAKVKAMHKALAAAKKSGVITHDLLGELGTENVTLYRGADVDPEFADRLWTSDKKKAEKSGAVSEVTLPASVIALNSTGDTLGADEFLFQMKKPEVLAAEVAAKAEAERASVRNPAREALLALDEGADRTHMQRAATDLGRLMNLRGNIDLMSANDMYEALITSDKDANRAEAAKLLAHAVARAHRQEGGSNGVHYIRSDGVHAIYVSNALTETQKIGVLAHEMGHGIIDEAWEGLKQTNKPLSDAITADYVKYQNEKAKEKGSAWARSHKDGLEGAESNDFHEWLANRVRDWLTTKEAPRNAAGSWYAELAKKFIEAFKQVVNYLRGFERPQQLDSVDKWLDAMAKPSDEINRVYGRGPPGMGISDRIEQRKIRLQTWASNATATNLEELNEVMPDIRDNLDNLLSPDDVAMLRRAVHAPGMRHRLTHLLGTNTQAADNVSKRTDDAVAYLYALTSMNVMTAPPAVNNVFAKMREGLVLKNRTFLEASTAEADEIVRRLNDRGAVIKPTENLIPESSPAARLYAERSKRYQQGTMGAIEKATSAYKSVFGWYLDEPYARIMRTGNGPLIDAWKAVQPSAYEIGGLQRAGESERARANYQIFDQRGTFILKDLGEAERTQLSKYLLTDPKANMRVSSKVKEAADKMRKLMEDSWKYEHTRTKVAHRESYWPMVPNHEYIDSNLSGVLDIYTSTPAFVGGWFKVKEDYKNWAAKHLSEEAAADTAEKLEAMWAQGPRKFVEFYITKDGQRMLPGQEILQLPADQLHTPSFRYANPRELNFLLEQATIDPGLHDQVLSTLNLDPKETIDKYFRNATKRMEHERFLHNLGPTGMRGLILRAKAQGATDADIRVFSDSIMAVQGLLGLRERDWLDKFIDARKEDSWLKQFHSQKTRVMNPEIQKAASLLMAWENISHLTLSLAAAAVDPAGQLARHGEWRIFTKSISETRQMFKDLAKDMPLSARAALLQRLGTLERSMRVQDLNATYSADQMHKGTARVMDTFFRFNGVEKLTDWARAMSSFAALSAINHWHDQAVSTDGSVTAEQKAIALKELHSLGLAPEDVVMENGDIKVLSYEEWADNMGDPAEQERDLRVRAAVHRFVDQSTVRPDATSRALWMSNPYYNIPAQWKAFSTAFGTQILKPAWAKMVEEGNATPMMWLALTGIPIMLFADLLRDAVKMSFSDDDDKDGDKKWRPQWKQNWALGDHVAYAVRRAGLYGGDELAGQVIDPMLKGRPSEAAAELGGVAVSDARKVARFGWKEFPLPFGDLTGNWGGPEKKTPKMLDRAGV